MTFTRLTLGEPRLRGKIKGGTVEAGGCAGEDIQYGVNILRDPGFESAGSSGEMLASGYWFPTWTIDQVAAPRILKDIDETVTNSYWWRTNGWGTDLISDFTSYHSPSIETANPRSGTYHYRYNPPDGMSDDLPYLQPIGAYTCNLDPPGVAGLRVNVGNIIEVGMYIYFGIEDPAALWTGLIVIVYTDSSGSYLGANVLNEVEGIAAGVYTEISVTDTVPSGAYYANIIYQGYDKIGPGSVNPYFFDIDDCWVSLIQ